jgi:hypothetical protein
MLDLYKKNLDRINKHQTAEQNHQDLIDKANSLLPEGYKFYSTDTSYSITNYFVKDDKFHLHAYCNLFDVTTDAELNSVLDGAVARLQEKKDEWDKSEDGQV